MSWPVEITAGCRLLSPDYIHIFIDAINERIAWLNEVQGETVVTPVSFGRFLLRDETNFVSIKSTISNKLVSMAGYFFPNISETGFIRPAGIRYNSLIEKYGDPRELYKKRMTPVFSAEWLFCVYNWLNELIYPIFDVDAQIFVESFREVTYENLKEYSRGYTLVYTKNGSSVELANGRIIENYASSGTRPNAETVDEYYEKAESIVPGWVSANSLNTYNFVNGIFGSLGPSSSAIYQKTVMKAKIVRFYSENSYINQFDCRAQWVNYAKWTRRQKDSTYITTNYPEYGTYFYGTVTNGVSDSFDLHIYDDPDFHFSNTMTEAQNDPELFFCATQYVRSGRVEVKIPSLPTPPYVYFNPIQEEGNA